MIRAEHIDAALRHATEDTDLTETDIDTLRSLTLTPAKVVVDVISTLPPEAFARRVTLGQVMRAIQKALAIQS